MFDRRALVSLLAGCIPFVEVRAKRRVVKQGFVCIALILLVMQVCPATANANTFHANTFHVDTATGSDTNDGLTRETAFATINKGVLTALDNDTVLVWPGSYNESVTIVNKVITVKSADDPAVVRASSYAAFAYYGIASPNSILTNFIVLDSGAGVYVSSGSPSISNLTIVNCSYGVEAVVGATPSIGNCILWGNTTDLIGCTAANSYVESEVGNDFIAYWRFDETSGYTASDEIGSNSGTVSGAAWSTGRIGGALDFDGLDDYVETTELDELDSVITVSAWVKVEDVSDHRAIFGRHKLSPQGYYAFQNFLRVMSSSRVGFGDRTGDGISLNVYSNTQLQLNRWYHIAATRDASNQIKIYINGVLDNSESKGVYNIPGVNYRIGRSNTGHFPFDGNIDEVAIFDRALSADQVMRLYESGRPMDPQFADAAGGDYHLKSNRGRYWPAHDVWVLDEFSSPCIDIADPNVLPEAEPAPNGGRINAGAYGNTAYASRREWMTKGDLNRDGIVDMKDFAIISEDWLEMMGWYQQ